MISDLEYDIEIELTIYIFMNFENTKNIGPLRDIQEDPLHKK